MDPTTTLVKRGWTPMERSYVTSHLLGGVGFYENLLWTLLEDTEWPKKVLQRLADLKVDFFRCVVGSGSGDGGYERARLSG